MTLAQKANNIADAKARIAQAQERASACCQVLGTIGQSPERVERCQMQIEIAAENLREALAELDEAQKAWLKAYEGR